ncbi:MAG: class A beta-lactamase-related serine hydrolase [Sphingobacteriales bacterium]|nr:MAG: class A beta-lactamase-related serine hydrolase [Sphingobacteriales bacterium]TAF81459.1 MAG: class A beta-lactamase-related serine hydrolase [Sphingobacteriales bacterium]
MKYTYTLIAVCLLFMGTLYSCSPKVNTGLVPVSNVKHLGLTEKNIDRLDSLLGSALINQWAAEASALVAKNGQIIFNKSIGFRDRETKALGRNIDEYRLGALSQPIVSLAALLLIEKGKLNLDDKVAKYIPQFLNPKVILSINDKDTTFTTQPALSDITIRQLLNQTSGIAGAGNSPIAMIYQKNNIPLFASDENITIQPKMQKLATLPLAVQPGTQYINGLNADVLGAVIEKASGLSLDSVVSQSILRPLGMVNTYFFLPLTKANRLSTMYSELPNGKLQRSPMVQKHFNLNYPIAGAKSYLSGASGMVSTAEDYAKFLQMILNKGVFNQKQIATTQSIALLSNNQIGSLMVGDNMFTFGFDLASNNNPITKAKPMKISRKGEFNTYCWVDSQRGVIALLFTQVYPSIHGEMLFTDFERVVNELFDGAKQ